MFAVHKIKFCSTARECICDNNLIIEGFKHIFKALSFKNKKQLSFNLVTCDTLKRLSTNVGTGTLNNLTLLDVNASPEVWTVKVHGSDQVSFFYKAL